VTCYKRGHLETTLHSTAKLTHIHPPAKLCDSKKTQKNIYSLAMGGNKHKKSFSFITSFFKGKKGRRDHDSYCYGDDAWGAARKIYPSDEDNTHRVVAEPGIDKRASAFIANFHATRVSEAIHHQQAR
ncbi:hypothetical protein Golax_001382, partial [Gossypium laxum]|nr:hypothetical protein [Gossypium laxum]